MNILIKSLPWYFGVDGASSEFDAEKSQKYGFTFINDHLDMLRAEEMIKLVSYMEQSQIVEAWMGTRLDPLDTRKRLNTSTWSDGVYRWNDLHTYLVKEYRFALPKEFMEHVFSFSGNLEHLQMLIQTDLEERFAQADEEMRNGNTDLIVRY